MHRGRAQTTTPDQAPWAIFNAAARRQRRQNARLFDREFEQFDMAAIQTAEERLVAAADLLVDLKKDLGGIGVMKSTFTKVSDMSGAEQAMDGRSRSQRDSVEKEKASVPVPITFKDFDISTRDIEASRNFGEALDDSELRAATRQVAEKLETMVFSGGDVTVGGNQIYGYLTHPNRNTVALGTAWDLETNPGLAALADVLAMVQAANDDNHFGPWWLYVPGNYGSSVLEDDFKAESDITVRQRLQRIAGMAEPRVADMLTDDNVVLVQRTSDVVDMAVASEIDVIERAMPDEFAILMKVWACMAPRVKADYNGRSGIVHLS